MIQTLKQAKHAIIRLRDVIFNENQYAKRQVYETTSINEMELQFFLLMKQVQKIEDADENEDMNILEDEIKM